MITDQNVFLMLNQIRTLIFFLKIYKKREYNKEVKKYFDFFRLKCLQYKINYVDVDIMSRF